MVKIARQGQSQNTISSERSLLDVLKQLLINLCANDVQTILTVDDQQTVAPRHHVLDIGDPNALWLR